MICKFLSNSIENSHYYLKLWHLLYFYRIFFICSGEHIFSVTMVKYTDDNYSSNMAPLYVPPHTSRRIKGALCGQKKPASGAQGLQRAAVAPCPQDTRLRTGSQPQCWVKVSIPAISRMPGGTRWCRRDFAGYLMSGDKVMLPATSNVIVCASFTWNSALWWNGPVILNSHHQPRAWEKLLSRNRAEFLIFYLTACTNLCVVIFWFLTDLGEELKFNFFHLF